MEKTRRSCQQLKIRKNTGLFIIIGGGQPYLPDIISHSWATFCKIWRGGIVDCIILLFETVHILLSDKNPFSMITFTIKNVHVKIIDWTRNLMSDTLNFRILISTKNNIQMQVYFNFFFGQILVFETTPFHFGNVFLGILMWTH